MVEPPVSYSYLESTVPTAACEVAISVGSAGQTAAVMGRKQTGDELNARAKANGYNRGGHTGKKTVVETAISTRTTP